MKTRATLATLVLAGLCSAASAGEVWTQVPGSGQLAWFGFDTGSVGVKVQKNNGGQITYNGRGGQFGGRFFSDDPSSADEFFRFFCIDLSQHAAAGPFAYSALELTSDPLARLFDIAYPNKAWGDFYDSDKAKPTDFGRFDSGIASAAFQLAVWELFFDNSSSYSLGGGTFKSTGVYASGSAEQQAVAQANAWLQQVKDGAGSAAGWTLYQFTNPSHQDYLSAIYREPPLTTNERTVPEPGTLAMLGLGIAALGAIRRRRR